MRSLNKYRWPVLTACVWILAAIVIYPKLIVSKRSTGQNSQAAQPSGNIDSIPPPFRPLSFYEVPTRLVYPVPDDGEELKTMKDGFLPIGWSRDGKFAYATEPSDEACGCYFFGIFIQDMITDKILWSWSYSSDTEENESDRSGMDLKRLWKRKNAEFTRQLNRYQINPVTQDRVNALPISERGGQMSFSLKNKTVERDGFDWVASAKLFRTVNGGAEKLLFSQDYLKGSNFTLTLSNGLAGYLRSPFENRVALLYYDKSWGYEGPPHVISLKPIGADISSLYNK